MEQRQELIGREQELARIEAALGGTQADAGATLIAVSGEPGIGKTRLLDELCREADRRGHLTLSGRGAEFERELPFGALVDALDDYLAGIPTRRLESLGEARLAELAQLFPALEPLGEAAPSGLQDERYRSHSSFRGLLELLAVKQPLVLTLDDLHWADQGTAELLSYLVRRPPRGAIVLVVSFREGQAPARLLAALQDAQREGRLTEIELGPLQPAQSEALLGERVAAVDRAELHRLAGGNPFYLEELAMHGASEAAPGSLDSASAPPQAGASVPAAVAAAMASELRALPEVSANVARGAAVAGDTFDLEPAAAAASVSEADCLAGIDDLLDRGVLRHTDAPRRFRFRHPIVHGAVYQDAPPGWRLEAHGRVAAELERMGAPALTRAPHVESSARAGDAAAIEVLREAAAAAALRAPATAAHWYESALALSQQGDDAARLGLLIPMAQALGYAGELDRARETLDEVLATLPADQLAVRGEVVAACARIDQLYGRHHAARALLENTLDELPDRRSPEATALKEQLAGACFFSGDFEGLRRWGSEALEEASAREDRATHATAVGLLGCAEYMTGDMPAARLRLEEAEGLFGGISDQQVAPKLTSLVWCGMCEIFLERFDRASALFERGIAVGRSTGHGHVTTLTKIGQGLVLVARGDLEAARELLDEAVESSLLTGNDQFLIWALWARCRAATLSGDLDGAIQLGERAVATAQGADDPVSAMAGSYLAEARFEAGQDPRRCREMVIAVLGGEGLPQVERGFQAHWYEILTRMELAAGEVEAAERFASLAAEAAAGLGIRGREAEARRAQAAVALARGDAGQAAEAALDAAGLAAAAGLPIEEARCRALAGRALLDGDREAAVEELDRARAQLDAHGATRYRDEAAGELRALGKRVTRPKRGRAEIGEGVGSLSNREREVADLVAAGHTNREIAAELYLSEKTIESHLARIFGKLGANKRTQVAAAIGREGEPAGG